MESDKHMMELSFFGCPARVLLELDLGRNNATALVPIGDATFVDSGAISEIRIPIHGPLLRRVQEVQDQAEFEGLG